MKNILIVDDSLIARKLILKVVEALIPDGSYHTANSGEQALEILEGLDETIDLALLDFNMPEMDGLELAKRLSDSQPAASLVLCTANAQEALSSRAVVQGLRVIHKPITEDKLRSLLNGELG